MNNKVVLLFTALILLSGCASQDHYEWGQYQETLFVVYHDPALKEEALNNYLQFVETGGTPQHPLAPGLYAEAGTFMLEQGNTKEAIRFYKMEYEAWPESQPMLGAMIENLEARQ